MYNLKSICKRVKRSSRGSTLVLVVVLFTVAVVLCAAVLTAVMSANMVSSENEKSKQAYFTARSAANTVISAIEKNPSSIPTNKNSIPVTIYNIDTKTMGEASAVVDKISNTEIRITGVGTYLNVTRKVYAYMDNNGIFNCLSFTGGNFGDSNSSTGPTLKGGMLISYNTITIKGNVYGVKNITSLGNNVYLMPSGTNNTVGEIHAKSRVDIKSGNVTITGNVTAANDNSIDCFDKSKVLGKIETPSNYPLPSSQDIQKAYPALNQANLNGQNGFLSNYFSTPSNYNSDGIISSSGLINNDNFFNNIITNSGRRKVIIDTSSGNVWICFNNKVTFNNLDFLVKGKNKLFLNLSDGTNLTLNNCNFKMMDSNSRNEIFILGTDSAKLYINGGEYDSCIYMNPSSGDLGINQNAIIKGSVISNQIESTSNYEIDYVSPDVANTPLYSIMVNAPPDVTNVMANWVFSRWDSK